MSALARRLAALAALGSLAVAALGAGPAGAADECKGLRVCLPVSGPWVVVPAGGVGVDWELACPLRGYVVGGTDARVSTRDVDVSIRGATGSPVGPGVTTRRSVVFHAVRTSAQRASSSFRPFAGCIPSNGGGGRALTSVQAQSPGLKPSSPLFSVVVTATVLPGRKLVRASCPAASRLVGATDAVGFAQGSPPTASQRGAVGVTRAVVEGAVVARVTATGAAGAGARVQVRALCTRSR